MKFMISRFVDKISLQFFVSRFGFIFSKKSGSGSGSALYEVKIKTDRGAQADFERFARQVWLEPRYPVNQYLGNDSLISWSDLTNPVGKNVPLKLRYYWHFLLCLQCKFFDNWYKGIFLWVYKS
jgi:hypothetical protein